MHCRHLLIPLAASLLASGLRAEAGPFTHDLEAARARARTEHKDVFVNFTGSDWCGWCIKLDREVFEKAEFKAQAGKDFELVQLDFPHDKSKQSEEVTARNKAWKRELNSTSFPDILLLDENGRVFARANYREGGVEPFLENLEALRQQRVQRDAAMTLANKVAGPERATHLDVALSALRSDDVLLTYYRDEIAEIERLDSSDQLGLRTKYRLIAQRSEIERQISRLCTGDDGQAMLAKLKEQAARTDIPVESRQYALYLAGAVACERFIKDPQQALEMIEQARVLAPDSPLAGNELLQSKRRLERRLAAKPSAPKKRN